jgi:hypothetical protein
MYFPYQKGRYEVAPGLLPFRGSKEQKLFEIDDEFAIYRQQFESNRSQERVAKYVVEAKDADAAAIGKICFFIAHQLAIEYPAKFRVKETANADELFFESELTQESFVIVAPTNSLKNVQSKINYISAWDAMGAQVPEDFAIWRMKNETSTTGEVVVSEDIEALNLNAPNHWSAEEKVGRSFAVVHAPVAHIEKISPFAIQLLDGILKKGPYVRFAWGVGTDARLNHHPESAPGLKTNEWNGRRFDAHAPQLFARVERQVLWGFPELNRALFTIRTYFQNVAELKVSNPAAVKGLIEALLSMSEQSLKYKGLEQDLPAILTWLREPHSG